MDYQALDDIKFGSAFIDERGLLIRLDTKTVRGYNILRKIAAATKRPVEANGDSYDDFAFCWITIPLTNATKPTSFSNKPPKRKKR